MSDKPEENKEGETPISIQIPTLLKKVRNQAEIILELQQQIADLEKALSAVTQWTKASEPTPLEREELKALRKAYVSFSKRVEGVATSVGLKWNFEIVCDPMTKDVWVLDTVFQRT
jgi:hypothetical protein